MSKSSVDAVMSEAEVSYIPADVDRIRVILYKNNKIFDSLSVRPQRVRTSLGRSFLEMINRVFKTVRSSK